MIRELTTGLGLPRSLAALAVAALAGPALGQARMSLPQVGLLSYRPPSAGPTVVRGVVGGGACKPLTVTRPVLGGTVHTRGPLHCEPRVIHGSGLTVNGRYNGDNLDVAFHLGSPVGVVEECHPVPPPCVVYPPYGYPYVYPYGWGWGWDDRTYVDNSYSRYSVIDGALVQPAYLPPAPAPTAAPAAPPPAPTTLERAEAALRAGHADQAAQLFQQHLRADPGDAAAMRSLAVALLRAGEPVQAAAMMRMAYRADPGLAEAPINLVTLFASDREVRQALLRAVAYANREESASGWLTVAALMQAEGRDVPARKMIEKGRKAGLEDAVTEAMSAALGG